MREMLKESSETAESFYVPIPRAFQSILLDSTVTGGPNKTHRCRRGEDRKREYLKKEKRKRVKRGRLKEKKGKRERSRGKRGRGKGGKRKRK